MQEIIIETCKELEMKALAYQTSMVISNLLIVIFYGISQRVNALLILQQSL